MKKIILTVAAVFAMSFANAQDLKSKKGENYLPQSGDWAIGFNADGLFEYVGNAFNNSGNNAPSVDYQNAGTIEFLVANNEFYFMEMNTRLQVEHPVTEMITGIDLVEEQIKIARGEKLGFTQNDLSIHGHAVELRVYAEDPLNNFLPSIGTLTKYVKPTGEGVRVDDGYEEGMPIPIYYDPMIAKLVTHGKDRTDAIQKMLAAIRDYKIEGVSTTLPFGTFVFEHEAFISGHFDTHFVKKYYTPEKLIAKQEQMASFAALAALKYWIEKQQELKIVEAAGSNWKSRLI